MNQLPRERTVALPSLRHGPRPRLEGLRVGQVVTGRAGRSFRVLATDEHVIQGDTATGPYALLVAQDDPAVRVIWPRHWYTALGETGRLFA